ncbi:MAG: PD-(D/E)XK nuclease family protein [Armatimonadetes bacterium]|nr:PD-(D/E)XK nuclease family protein [Armatimonadota bacterium]
MPKPTFSPTKFSTYLRCPLQYEFTYLKKLAKFYGRARAGTSLGGSVHRTLETLMGQGGADAVSEEQLLDKFQQTWVSKGYASEEEERAHFDAGHAMIREFYAAAREEKEEKRETILAEKMLKQDRGPYILSGKIDRLDRLEDGSLEIVDYKSGRSALEEEDVARDMGLMVYEILVKSKFPDTPVRVALHALRINTKVSLRRTEEEGAAIEQFLDRLAEEIMFTHFYPGRPIEDCPDCDYRRICPVYKPKGYPILTT